MSLKKLNLIVILAVLISSATFCFAQNEVTNDETELIDIMHSISSHKLYDYIAELSDDKFEGRLTGTEGYDLAAEWLAEKFISLGVTASGENGSFFQYFDIPYTLVFPGSEVFLHIPYKKSFIKKYYQYFDEFIPGSTSGSGQVTAEVIYAGYGITAPELGYDEYKGIDVEGKIVLLEREVPLAPEDDPELFKKWRPYSFHQYKLENAVKHGAVGMLYNYGPIANPNNAYVENFVYSHVGDTVVADLFQGTGKTHAEVIEKIKETLKPASFSTKKIVTIKNLTEYFADGRGANVIGIIEGIDPELKNEVIMIGSHLDHLGRCYEIIPGANDNASAVAVTLGIAEAINKLKVGLKRSVMFISFGAEEQSIVGSKYYLEHPIVPLEKTLCLINMDGVGCGDKLTALAAKNHPALWNFIDEANQNYVHRKIRPTDWLNIARPRLDAARFGWAGVPLVSFSAYGAPSHYHTPDDNIKHITPEILEDLTQILFLAIVDIANQDSVDFR